MSKVMVPTGLVSPEPLSVVCRQLPPPWSPHMAFLCAHSQRLSSSWEDSWPLGSGLHLVPSVTLMTS